MATLSSHLTDRSPIFHYRTQYDGLGWFTGYDRNGNDTVSYKYTNDLAVSFVDFNVTATSVTFLVEGQQGACSAIYSINGSSPIPACPSTGSSFYTLNDLPSNAVHSISYTPLTLRPATYPGPRFHGIASSTSLDVGKNDLLYNQTDSLEHLVYGGWLRASHSEIAQLLHDESANTMSNSSSDAVMLSVREADEIRYVFSEGHALYIYGITGPQMGSLEISVDDSIVSIVDLKTPYIDYQAPLYMTVRALHTDPQSVIIRKLDSNLTVLSDIITTRSRARGSKGIRQRTLIIIIACAVGGVVLLLTVFLLLLARSRRVRIERTEQKSPGHRDHRRMSTRSANKVTLWSNLWSTLGSPPAPVSSDGALLKISPDSVRGKSFFKLGPGQNIASRNPWDTRSPKPLATTNTTTVSGDTDNGGDYCDFPQVQVQDSRLRVSPVMNSAPKQTLFSEKQELLALKRGPPAWPMEKVGALPGPPGLSQATSSTAARSAATMSTMGLGFLHTPFQLAKQPLTTTTVQSKASPVAPSSAVRFQDASESPSVDGMLNDQSAGALHKSASEKVISPVKNLEYVRGPARPDSLTMPYPDDRVTGTREPVFPSQDIRSQLSTGWSNLRAPASILRTTSVRSKDISDEPDASIPSIRRPMPRKPPPSESEQTDGFPELYFEMTPYSPATSRPRSFASSGHERPPPRPPLNRGYASDRPAHFDDQSRYHARL